MSLITKIAGIIITGIDLGIFYIDYLIFSAIGELTLWIATSMNATDAATAGIQVIGWLLTLGVMLAIAMLGGSVALVGLRTIAE